MGTAFDRFGTHEPAPTGAFGLTLGYAFSLLADVLRRPDLPETDTGDVAVRLDTADAAGRTETELLAPTAHVILAAKQGWLVTGDVQLAAYAPRLFDSRENREFVNFSGPRVDLAGLRLRLHDVTVLGAAR